ncbi:MAG: DNRLRE domain-containing protein, partial [Chloroflexi bacterium]|nr:DNRLRE domain-containing protein [Chloroflexota bacterium]
YNDSYLYLEVTIFDRRLWYDESPTPDSLTQWDAVSLYLQTAGDDASAPGPSAYRFDAQLNWWEERERFQAAYRGDGAAWVQAGAGFASNTGWRGSYPNGNQDDRGWLVEYHIPFASLGLGGPPPSGTVWRLGLTVHDRDDSAGTPIAAQKWPQGLDGQQPRTWGQMAFGMADYRPPQSLPGGSVTIRHGLNGATVMDADVGGSSVCGELAAPAYFPTWGSLNYGGKVFANIQNQEDVADWPCFAKYYVTFPLGTVPVGKVIRSATLRLHQFGNAGAGWDPGPKRSWIQVLAVDGGWEEATITWNNAPLARQNVSAAWVEPLETPPPWPGAAREWDVSGAAAEAYAAGSPLHLALYEADWDYHSGKYFITSDADVWSAEGRPALVVEWGEPTGPTDPTPTQTATRTATRVAAATATTTRTPSPSLTPHPPTATATQTATQAAAATATATRTPSPSLTPSRTATATASSTATAAPRPTPTASVTALPQTCYVGITPFYTLAYGEVLLNGVPAPIGTIVQALSPRGDVVGCVPVLTPGSYGLMPVYGEDPGGSPPVPGMRAQEKARFFINGLPAVPDVGFLWQHAPDLVTEVNLQSAEPAPILERYLPLVLRQK